MNNYLISGFTKIIREMIYKIKFIRLLKDFLKENPPPFFILLILIYLMKNLLYKTKPLELILLFAPTSPWQPVPKFSGNFGTGDVLRSHVSQPKFSWKFWDRKHLATSRCVLRSKILGNFGTRNASSPDYTRRQISRKFWNGAVQIFQEILERIFLLSRVKFLGNFVHTKFSDKFGTGARAVFRNFQNILGSTISWKFWVGNCSLCFLLQNSPGILGREMLLREIHETSNF